MSDVVLDSLPARVHMVGIAGAGLSAIAHVLAMQGHTVTGSDLQASHITEQLNEMGIETYVGHRPGQIGLAEALIVSSAVPDDNPEILAARAASVPVLKRHQVLGMLMSRAYGIAVAGTHGKTTTTAMLATIFEQLGERPTFIVGGVVTDLDTNARAGGGRHFILEADEYDRTFHGLWPDVAVVTNLEMDHPDCYRDIEDVKDAFRTFLGQVSPEGQIVACKDSAHLMDVIEGNAPIRSQVTTYGVSCEAEQVVHSIEATPSGGIRFQIASHGASWCDVVELPIPGSHNALNAAAALIVADHCGLDIGRAAEVLAGFRGVRRRFEVKGEARGVTVVDDYAHHPTEVRATLSAARMRYPNRRLWTVFQPHTYSRIETLLDQFSDCFQDADFVIITDIYRARSREKATIRAEDLLAVVRHPGAIHISDHDEIVERLCSKTRCGDVVLTLGAGDSDRIGERLLSCLETEPGA